MTSPDTLQALDIDWAMPQPTAEQQASADLALLICQATPEAEHSHLNRLLDALIAGSYRQGFTFAESWRGGSCNPSKYRCRRSQAMLIERVAGASKGGPETPEAFAARLVAGATALGDLAYSRGHAAGRKARKERSASTQRQPRPERASQWDYCVTSAQLKPDAGHYSFGASAKPRR